MIVKCLLEKDIPKDSLLIDFGCGTGILGENLNQVGYTNVVGVDGSPEMLEVARAKNVYKSLHCCLIGSEELKGLEKGTFDVALSSACMIKGHFPNNCFDTFLDYMKP